MEYKSFFLVFKLFTNIIVPFPMISTEYIIAVPYLFSILSLGSVLIFIKLKKISYFKKYLTRVYIPSKKLAIITSLIDIITVSVLYYFLYKENRLTGVFYICLSIVQGIATLGTFILLLTQKARNTALISYNRHKYKIGILARDVGGENGLKMGQPVEIIKETSTEYIVKDTSNNDFSVCKDDIETILDVV